MAAIGDRFGSYVIERELGRGGMGVVYAARHQILGHHVALKILHAEWAQRDDVVQRFFNEARAAAAIDHPGIVAVRDVGVTENREAFLVMELLPGASLADRLKAQGPLPVATALDCIRQVACALGAAHAAGIVHRDLKPDNILLVDDAQAPHGLRALLLDFGVAKLTGDLRSGDLKTKTGALLGTPHYMSPEQCDGERAIDPRSDLYSLGCVLFQTITGKLPFEGGIGAVIGMHIHVPPPLLRSVSPSAPTAIEAIVSRLMAKAPEARFATAAELVAAIDTFVPDAADHVAPPRRFEVGTAETLAIAHGSDPTVASVVPQSRRNVVQPGRVSPAVVASPPRRGRPPRARGVLLLGMGLAGVGIGALAFALTRDSRDATPRDGVATSGDAALAISTAGDGAITVAGDAALARSIAGDGAIALAGDGAVARSGDAAVGIVGDAPLADAAEVIAAGPPDAARVDAGRDAQLAVTSPRDARVAVLRDAESDAAPATDNEAAIRRHLANIAKADADFDASKLVMLLEPLIDRRDPRLARARDDARKAIAAHARRPESKIIHLAVVNHDWKAGLDQCRGLGSEPGIDVAVQCTALACILDDEANAKTWARVVGYEPMIEKIATFCERHHKP